MGIRSFVVSTAWLILLTILLLGIYFPSLDDGIDFSPKYNFQYWLFYFILTINLCSSFTKQTVNQRLKRRAQPIALFFTLFVLLLIELIAMYIYPERNIQWLWNFWGLIGAYTGLLSFRLLYGACY